MEVAQLLYDAGCSHVVIAAGLLHDTVGDIDVSVPKLRTRVGADVANLVRAVSEDASIPSYRERNGVPPIKELPIAVLRLARSSPDRRDDPFQRRPSTTGAATGAGASTNSRSP
jgi:hypothetical protein